ncbi:MAG: HDIG domain-containing metalloprotein [Clostridiales bacterium]
MKSEKTGNNKNYFNRILKNTKIQKIFLLTITIIISFSIIHSGAIPKRYNLVENEVSEYDINAPRDIENEYLTKLNAIDASDKVLPVLEKTETNEILKNFNVFFDDVVNEREILYNLINNDIVDNEEGSESFNDLYNKNIKSSIDNLNKKLKLIDLNLSEKKAEFLLSENISDKEIEVFRNNIAGIIKAKYDEEITKDILNETKNVIKGDIKNIEYLNSDLIEISNLLIDELLVYNTEINVEKTEQMKKSIYDDIIENNKVIIKVGERIINRGDIVKTENLELLRELDLLEKKKYDYKFSFSILFIIIFLTLILTIHANLFCREIFNKMNLFTLLAVIVIVTLFLSRATLYLGFSPLTIPIFIAPMLITILIDVKISVIANVVLSVAITLITKGDIGFLFMALTSGTLTAFIVEKSDNRIKLFVGGVAIACLNVLIIISLGAINRSYNELIPNSISVFSNGLISTIFTIGTLQIWESIFNIVTPLKLLEIGNPNHPLIKKLLLEAPGTYHHSLLVANLAEVATEAIDGDSLLARVGAYYHDIGKIKRPNFFKENQFNDNPHDKLKPNLSVMVLTSHTSDGLELAKKYKIPKEIRDIIMEHHGTTLAAFFYVKAKNCDRLDSIREEDFRYKGPKPRTKESAVVMLADSVEAAVRSMTDKTKGKIQGQVRKIIKDKLEDGQLDLSDLTLRDLDKIANSFMKVLSGYFHQRTEYPKLEKTRHKVKIV